MEKLLQHLKDELKLANSICNKGYNSERDEGYISGQKNIIEDIIPKLEKLMNDLK